MILVIFLFIWLIRFFVCEIEKFDKIIPKTVTDAQLLYDNIHK